MVLIGTDADQGDRGDLIGGETSFEQGQSLITSQVANKSDPRRPALLRTRGVPARISPRGTESCQFELTLNLGNDRARLAPEAALLGS